MIEIYKTELAVVPFKASAFVTHGLSTFIVLIVSWTLFCCVISWAGDNINAVKSSKLQPYEKSHDSKLVQLATKTVIRNWFYVFVQTIVFAPSSQLTVGLGRVGQ